MFLVINIPYDLQPPNRILTPERVSSQNGWLWEQGGLPGGAGE